VVLWEHVFDDESAISEEDVDWLCLIRAVIYGTYHVPTSFREESPGSRASSGVGSANEPIMKFTLHLQTKSQVLGVTIHLLGFKTTKLSHNVAWRDQEKRRHHRQIRCIRKGQENSQKQASWSYVLQ
jgi:hypothetical protein